MNYSQRELRDPLVTFATKDPSVVLQVKTQDIQPYIRGLDGRLEQLRIILEKEGNGFVLPFINRIRNSLRGFSLKYQINGDEHRTLPFTIDASYSGWPTVKDFYILEIDQRNAEINLSTLPQEKEIISSIARVLMHDGSPEKYQNILRIRKFNEFIKSAKILRESKKAHLEKGQQENGKRLYSAEWGGIEFTTQLPVFYRMIFTQNSGSLPLNDLPSQFELALYACLRGVVDVRRAAMEINNAYEDIHPKIVQKVTIGPFHSIETRNNGDLDSLLKGYQGEPVLRLRTDAVASFATRNHVRKGLISFFDRHFTREEYGPIDSVRKMIVPFGMKQRLQGHDEYGPCTIYGVTSDGGIAQ